LPLSLVNKILGGAGEIPTNDAPSAHMMASRHVELHCSQVPFAVYILI
jgi:hypothetical protein